MTEVPALSGRTLESLQAEADLLRAKEDLDFAERYLYDSMTLQVILTSLAAAYPNHTRTLRWAMEDTRAVAARAGIDVDNAKDALERAKTKWENQ